MTTQQKLEVALYADLMGLTLKQPYAGLILLGKVETRTRNTEKRGWTLITSSATPYSYLDVQKISGDGQAMDIFAKLGSRGIPLIDGHAIALVYLEHTYQIKLEHETHATYCLRSHLLSRKHFAWEFSKVIPIKPFPIKGALGLWNANTEEIKSQIQLL